MDPENILPSSLMKLGKGTDENVLSMQVILFLLSHENCGYFGNRNSKDVAKTYGSRTN